MKTAFSLISIFFIFMILFSAPDTLNSKDDISNQDQKIYWARTYGKNSANDNIGYDIKPTRNGGYIITGLTWAFGAGECDLWILKISPKGEIQWQKAYGGSGYDGYWAADIQQTDDDGYIVAGDTTSFGSMQMKIWILKLSPSGDIEWQKIYGGFGIDYPGDIQITNDGGFIVVGTAYGPDRNHDMWVFKLTHDGEIEWQKLYGNSHWQDGNSIQQTSDGGFIVSGDSIGSGYDSWILKLDSTGDILWQKFLSGDGRSIYLDSDNHVFQTNDGGYILVESTDIFGAGEHDIWLVKLNANGDIQWQKAYGGSEKEAPGYVNSIQQTNDGGYILTGLTHSFGFGDFTCWFLKLNHQGVIEWQKIYKGNPGEKKQVFAIYQIASGDMIVSGYEGQRGKYGYLFLKLNKDGEISSVCDLFEDTRGSSSKTNISLFDLDADISAWDITPQTTNAVPQDTFAGSNLTCWNLCQPPESITLANEVNRSLFRKEIYHKLSWSAHPYNDQFTITEYRIYSEYAGNYELIGSVSGNTYEYRAGPFSGGEDVKYAITSVDSEGNESPKSQTVES